MPIYDYVCGVCRHRFEVLHGLNEAGPAQCPLCEGPVTRAFAPPTILFKGSGWAKMDRRSAGTSGKKRVSSGEKAGGAVAGAASGDAAPAPGSGAGEGPSS